MVEITNYKSLSFRILCFEARASANTRAMGIGVLACFVVDVFFSLPVAFVTFFCCKEISIPQQNALFLWEHRRPAMIPLP
jgi:hypothetical protein